MAMAPDDAGYDKLTAAVSQEAGLAAAEAVTLLSELQGTVYALLTPEQQVKYLELRAAQKEKMQEYREQRKACMSEDGATREGCMHKGKGKGMRHHKNCDGKDCPHQKTPAEAEAEAEVEEAN
jgi:hypothetical protein